MSSDPICSIFAAQPDPDHLTDLYSAIKANRQSVSTDEKSDPVSVLWYGQQTTDIERRAICELNLSQTVERFLQLEVEFIDTFEAVTPRPGTERQSLLHKNPFIERLSLLILSQLGQVARIEPALAN